MRLRGKRALLTGAARGIGLACASLMAREGARVCLTDIDEAAVQAAARGIGTAAVAMRLDVTDADGWRNVVAAAERALGGLDTLVNNAGICIPGGVEDLSIADWDRTLEVDLKSVFLGCRAALPVLARHAPGSVVNISSVSGLVAAHNLAAYNAAKAGVGLLTKSVALDAARRRLGVRCNSVHPAFIDTGLVDGLAAAGSPEALREKLARQIPLGRIGTVEDVAWAVIYLASEESSFVTGSEIKLDGGLTAM